MQLRWARSLGIALILACARPVAAQVVTQVFNLHNGWNSIYLEVQPEGNRLTNLLAGVPYSSVWTWSERESTVQFVREQTEMDYNKPEWLVHFPVDRPESFKNRLHRMYRHSAYLINLGTNLSATLAIAGQPAPPVLRWNADSYNLRGFPVDPAMGPTCAEYFRYSTAHYDDSGAGQVRPIYRLMPGGQWQIMANTDRLEAGVAYWVWCEGGSTYTAPLELELPVGRTLDFGKLLSTTGLLLWNRASVLIDARISGGNTLPLAYGAFDPEKAIVWTPLPTNYSVGVEAGQKTRVRLAAERQRLAGAAEAKGVLEISDGRGVRYQLPVSVARWEAGGDSPLSGLWLGLVALSAVSEVNGLKTNLTAQPGENAIEVVLTNETGQITGTNYIGNVTVGSDPTPVNKPFYLRLLMHVDAAGHATLLKEVTQLWQDGTYSTNASGVRETATPGKHVLVTDPELIGKFKPGALRDGEYVGRRFSTVDYDFYGTNKVACSGQFQVGQTVSAEFNLPAQGPTNPFRHKYHPDHDNLDAFFQNEVKEAYDITRQVALTLLSTQSNENRPGAGSEWLKASYRETYTGLHRLPIVATGNVELRRLVPEPVLDPQP
jgi:hypothetical protein